MGAARFSQYWSLRCTGSRRRGYSCRSKSWAPVFLLVPTTILPAADMNSARVEIGWIAQVALGLGVFDATMIAMGGIIGSGIFINSYPVAQHLRRPGRILLACRGGSRLALPLAGGVKAGALLSTCSSAATCNSCDRDDLISVMESDPAIGFYGHGIGSPARCKLDAKLRTASSDCGGRASTRLGYGLRFQ
jgi:hypothetical protein